MPILRGSFSRLTLASVSPVGHRQNSGQVSLFRRVERSAAVGPCSPSGEAGSKTMDTNVVGALTYLAGFVTGIVFLVLDPYKSNSFVRFHAFQSIFFNVAWVAFWIVWMILSAVLTPLTAGIFGLIACAVDVDFHGLPALESGSS